ncbi:MAG: hypothetical protein H0T79_04180 [Deltaproteobacteria bacterium]|nr:hypothetical protein [Deltaproteobacteria bacterium]
MYRTARPHARGAERGENEIGQVLPADGWLFYVVYGTTGDESTTKLEWVQR